MDSLRRLLAALRTRRAAHPLVDEWMPMATLWPATSPEALRGMRVRWAQALSSRGMSGEA